MSPGGQWKRFWEARFSSRRSSTARNCFAGGFSGKRHERAIRHGNTRRMLRGSVKRYGRDASAWREESEVNRQMRVQLESDLEAARAARRSAARELKESERKRYLSDEYHTEEARAHCGWPGIGSGWCDGSVG